MLVVEVGRTDNLVDHRCRATGSCRHRRDRWPYGRPGHVEFRTECAGGIDRGVGHTNNGGIAGTSGAAGGARVQRLLCCLPARSGVRSGEPPAGTAPESDASRALSAAVEQLRTSRFYVGPEDPGTTTIESVEPKDAYVLVTVCHYTTMVLYGPPASPGGEPIVQNNTPGTLREALQFVRVADGSWRMSHGETLLNKAGVNECRSPR